MKAKFAIFFLILIITAGFIGYWYYQNRIFSKEVLKLEILGPESVQMGQEIEYTLRYKNNGDFTLESPRLIFEYPEYSLTPEGRRVTKDLEDIYPGEEITIKFKGRLLGKETDLKEAKAWLSYQPKNLKARYESQTSFTSKIELTPITLEFDLPSKIENGKELQFSLNYFSNVNYSFSQARIIIEYPENFEFLESDPRALEKTEWEIPNFKKAEGGRIVIKGILRGQLDQYVNFVGKLGIWEEGEFILLKETKKEVEIIEPQLHISQRINGVTDYIALPGETLRYEIFFRNIGSSPFENLFLLNRLESPAFDLATLKPVLGEAKPSDNLVIWDWKQVPELRFLDVGKEGKVEFEVKLKENWPILETDEGTIIKNKVDISQINQEFQIKVNSKLEVFQQVDYQPPNTYTITWEVKNYYNDVKNVKVKAVLPQGVELTGNIAPQTESAKFSFDRQSREIVWLVSEEVMEAGAGINTISPFVSFQVEKQGIAPQIIKEVRIEGEDLWTEKIIRGSIPSVPKLPE